MLENYINLLKEIQKESVSSFPEIEILISKLTKK